jgi:hypothetical protein
MFLQQGSYIERYSTSRDIGLFINFVYYSPQKGALPRKKTKIHSHGSPGRRKVYIQWGATWFYKGIVNDIAVTAPVPSNLQQDAFRLGFARTEPH